MTTAEERLQIACQTIQAIFDNWQNDGTFGRLVETLRERLQLQGVEGSWEQIQCSGALSINNALPFQDEKDWRDKMLDRFIQQKVGVVWRDAQRAFSDDWPDQFTIMKIEQVGPQVWLTVQTEDGTVGAMPLSEILYIEDLKDDPPPQEPQALTDDTPTIKLTPGT